MPLSRQHKIHFDTQRFQGAEVACWCFKHSPRRIWKLGRVPLSWISQSYEAFGTEPFLVVPLFGDIPYPVWARDSWRMWSNLLASESAESVPWGLILPQTTATDSGPNPSHTRNHWRTTGFGHNISESHQQNVTQKSFSAQSRDNGTSLQYFRIIRCFISASPQALSGCSG